MRRSLNTVPVFVDGDLTITKECLGKGPFPATGGGNADMRKKLRLGVIKVQFHVGNIARSQGGG